MNIYNWIFKITIFTKHVQCIAFATFANKMYVVKAFEQITKQCDATHYISSVLNDSNLFSLEVLTSSIGKYYYAVCVESNA